MAFGIVPRVTQGVTLQGRLPRDIQEQMVMLLLASLNVNPAFTTPG